MGIARARRPFAAIRSLAGHVSKQMLPRYSHIRNDAKRPAIDVFERQVGRQPD